MAHGSFRDDERVVMRTEEIHSPRASAYNDIGQHTRPKSVREICVIELCTVLHRTAN